MRYAFRAILGIVGCWILSAFLLPNTYPPRHLVLPDYVFAVIVGVSAGAIAFPNARVRCSAYYAVIAGLPLILHVISMYTTTMDIHGRLGRDPGIITGAMPLGGVFVLLTGLAVASSYALVRIRWKRQTEINGNPDLPS